MNAPARWHFPRPGRWAVAAFCWLTAAYAFVASSAFAYQQFIKPRVVSWLGLFADWHAVLFWVWCAAAIRLVWPDVHRRGWPRRLTMAFIAGCGAAGLWNTLKPVLPSLTDGPRSVLVGVVALVPLIWLAIADHTVAASYVAQQRVPDEPAPFDRTEGRLFVIFLGSAIFVAALYTVRTSIALIGAFEPDLFTTGLAIGFAWSLANHALIFCGAFLVTALIMRLTRRHFVLQYVALVVGLVAGLGFVFDAFVGSAIALSGAPAAVAAVTAAVAIVGTWTGGRLRMLMGEQARLVSGLDVFFGPAHDAEDRSLFARRLGGVAATAFALAWLAGLMDWDFLLLKSGVLVVWLMGFGALYRSVSARVHLPVVTIAVCTAAPLGVHALVTPSAETVHVLERYAVYNPSFLLTDGVLGSGPTTSIFDLYLRANSGFTDVDVPPVSIDFVQSLGPAPVGDKPLIFLFVIDSLRRDYLSPFNSEVSFTPRIAEFAAESVAFQNAFTRYGGTGLSMPAIWAGSGILHKQYVQPFAPMNALEKLLDANSYRKALSHDHITVQLVQQRPGDIELDRGREEMKFDFCTTLDEVQGLLKDGAVLDRPLFVHTRSLNMHVIEVRNSTVPEGESYPGFYDRYATRVRRIDGCFGRFVDFLKARRLYDRSLIVLTADHGELIGEDGRWGHSYHLYPQVTQVPLIIHLPAAVGRDGIDTAALNLSTDIVPTIYAALGYQPEPPNQLGGVSLLDGSERAIRARRRRTFVMPASYGPVYAVLRHNGQRLFIADGVNKNDQLYERVGSGPWVKGNVTDDVRIVNRLEIRRYIDEVGRTYHVNPRF